MQKALSGHCSRADGKVIYKNYIILVLWPWKYIVLTPTACSLKILSHYTDVTMSAMASQITRVSIVCPIVCSGTGQRSHQTSASLPFVRGIHRSPVDAPHNGTGTRKMFSWKTIRTLYFRVPLGRSSNTAAPEELVMWPVCDDAGRSRECSTDERKESSWLISI